MPLLESARRSGFFERFPRCAPTNERARAARGRARPNEGGPAGPDDSNVEVEEELVRGGTHADRVQLLRPLVVQPLVDRVLREDVALEEELVIALHGVERVLEAARH